MHTTKPQTASRFTKATEHKGVNLTLIGDWIDLAAYYAGDDGNAWCYSASTRRFTNCGAITEFRASFAQRYRGRLFTEAA